MVWVALKILPCHSSLHRNDIYSLQLIWHLWNELSASKLQSRNPFALRASPSCSIRHGIPLSFRRASLRAFVVLFPACARHKGRQNKLVLAKKPPMCLCSSCRMAAAGNTGEYYRTDTIYFCSCERWELDAKLLSILIRMLNTLVLGVLVVLLLLLRSVCW